MRGFPHFDESGTPRKFQIILVKRISEFVPALRYGAFLLPVELNCECFGPGWLLPLYVPRRDLLLFGGIFLQSNLKESAGTAWTLSGFPQAPSFRGARAQVFLDYARSLTLSLRFWVLTMTFTIFWNHFRTRGELKRGNKFVTAASLQIRIHVNVRTDLCFYHLQFVSCQSEKRVSCSGILAAIPLSRDLP